jgi:hypothetical protein
MIGAPRKLLRSWCRRRDLNPHGGEPHRILSPARLPFHHSGTRDNINNQAAIGIQEDRCIRSIGRAPISIAEYTSCGICNRDDHVRCSRADNDLSLPTDSKTTGY